MGAAPRPLGTRLTSTSKYVLPPLQIRGIQQPVGRFEIDVDPSKKRLPVRLRRPMRPALGFLATCALIGREKTERDAMQGGRAGPRHFQSRRRFRQLSTLGEQLLFGHGTGWDRQIHPDAGPHVALDHALPRVVNRRPATGSPHERASATSRNGPTVMQRFTLVRSAGFRRIIGGAA